MMAAGRSRGGGVSGHCSGLRAVLPLLTDTAAPQMRIPSAIPRRNSEFVVCAVLGDGVGFCGVSTRGSPVVPVPVPRPRPRPPSQPLQSFFSHFLKQL